MDEKNKLVSSSRLFFVFSVIVLILITIMCRLYYISAVHGDKLKLMAEKQWVDKTLIKPTRGEILDRNYNQLATNEPSSRIDLDLRTLKQSLKDKNIGIDTLEKQLSSILGMDKSNIDKIMNSNDEYSALKRGISSEQAKKIQNLGINGIVISSDTKRYYVNGNFLSQVLGHTNSDGQGLSGVELMYNKLLTGTPGVSISEVDNKREDLPYNQATYTKPIDGKDLVLTIDAKLQLFAEKAADTALKTNKAKSVTITIMNPKNGEILAMVNKPSNDLNSSNNSEDLWKNNAVQWAFEPGSIFKAVTSEVALETSKSYENQEFLCNASVSIDGNSIYNWDKADHGMMNLQGILKNSNNVGFAKLGVQLGKENLYSHINKFGFGTKTGIDLPGESSGIVKNVKDIKNLDLANTAFGQGIAMTQIQYMSVFNAIANGGKWATPHIMKETGNFNKGNEFVGDSKFNDTKAKNIMDKDVTTTLRGYLEKVVSDGVGKNAYVEGCNIAGKTGTAQKAYANGGGYEPGKYVSSFAGMAPYQNPKITLIISIDEPDASNYYSAQTAAPVAKELFSEIYNYTDYIYNK
ncbi:stage V sporulation protein D [Clostridium tyrobutyricum]|uniref:penicillin-binding transpeptidase domain-containing protein n=1 Tax=Clostridium tyrobutyricum TaxID=1519 RepID=UPI001C386824|nr:penicillin-binding transpeptidase domain-containing protein [Clostridium tyrobutyricum]MBV4418945.1 stage V sporulation protein D [Clostridium tyrobutyricum]